MEVAFSNELRDRLSRMAAQRGSDSTALVVEAVERMVAEEDQFRAAVREGIAAADRGEFVEHAEVWNRVEKVLHG